MHALESVAFTNDGLLTDIRCKDVMDERFDDKASKSQIWRSGFLEGFQEKVIIMSYFGYVVR
ncbi:hypothetical protein EON65_30825 [archaeon]|nr:MAG: hypothetical protein EON65_30825 [archaeon]